MARDISIAISAKDNFTDSIKKMQNMQTTFRKDLGQLNTELNKMNKNKVELKVDMSKAKNELKDAEKSFKKLGDEANRNKLIMAQTKYDNVKRNFDLVSQGAKQAERDIRNLTDTMTKSEGKGGGFGSSSTSSKGTLGTLAQAGLFNMVGQSVSGALRTGTTSLLGSSDGQALGSIVSGAMSGAAIGSIIPGIGTAVGAAVGTIAGGINAMTQKFSEKDDAFKSVVQSNYELAKSIQDNSLKNGSNIAGSREQTKISFSTLLGGDDVADGFLDELTNFAAKTPYQFDQLTTMSKTLLAYGYKMEEIVPLLTKVGDGGSALGLSADEINTVATMMGRMKNTGKTTLEYLNPIMERGIPVIDFLADGLGVAKENVLSMVSDGLIPGAQAAEIIANAMGETYSGNMEKQAQTYEGLISTLTDVQNKMDQAMGEAYNEKRKEGLNAQIDFLSGENADKMQEAYAMIGEWQAELENGYEKAIRDSMKNMMESQDYIDAQAEGDKVKMGQLLAEAQVKGENDYKASEGYQLQLASDLELIGMIRNDTALNSEYYNTGYQMGQEFSKGLAAAKNTTISASDFTPNTPTTYKKSGSVGIGNSTLGYAYGLNYVPYDNFPALLHQGEKVVTASEARSNSGSPSVTVTGNNFTIREEADINKVASAIVSQLIKAQTNYGG
ncbi:MAG: tape measure protein [Serratia marcescens]|nr:tape measure protein [Serratia marcescens]